MAALDDLPPRLHFEGSRFIKPNGKEIILRGVSLGSWGEDQPTDPTTIAELGANCVRIGLRFWMPDPQANARDDNGFAFLSRSHVTQWLDLITAASAAGLWVIPFIDSNCGQNGMQDSETMRFCDPYNAWGAQGHNFCTDPGMRRVFASIVWPAVAARLRPIAKIAMLELQPEMLDGRGPEWAPRVSEFYQDVIAGVRSVDADTPVLIGARNAYDIRLCAEALLSNRTDVCYTGNLLNQWIVDPEKFDDGLGALVAMRDEYNVPIFVQQLGRLSAEDLDLSLLRTALDKMRAAKVGFAYWQWKQHVANGDGYGLNYPTADGAGWIAKEDEQSCLSEYWSAQTH